MPDNQIFYKALFLAAFISQIALVSGYYPRRLVALAVSFAGASGHGDEAGRRRPLRGYVLLNDLIILSGLILAAALTFAEVFERMTPKLLSIGGYFFLQLLPLILPGPRRLRADREVANMERLRTDSNASGLFTFVGPLPVGLAVVLAIAYVAFAMTRWSGELNTHLLKVGIFSATQTLFAAAIAWNLRALRRDSAEVAVRRYRNLVRLLPVLVLASIMISAYYFGKEFIAIFDVAQLRPTMMSVFLQFLAIFVFHALYLGGQPKRGTAHG